MKVQMSLFALVLLTVLFSGSPVQSKAAAILDEIEKDLAKVFELQLELEQRANYNKCMTSYNNCEAMGSNADCAFNEEQEHWECVCNDGYSLDESNGQCVADPPPPPAERNLEDMLRELLRSLKDNKNSS